jgi:hypothetical protein
MRGSPIRGGQRKENNRRFRKARREWQTVKTKNHAFSAGSAVKPILWKEKGRGVMRMEEMRRTGKTTPEGQNT